MVRQTTDFWKQKLMSNLRRVNVNRQSLHLCILHICDLSSRSIVVCTYRIRWEKNSGEKEIKDERLNAY